MRRHGVVGNGLVDGQKGQNRILNRGFLLYKWSASGYQFMRRSLRVETAYGLPIGVVEGTYILCPAAKCRCRAHF